MVHLDVSPEGRTTSTDLDPLAGFESTAAHASTQAVP
jgi:hypothetical protein